MYMGNVVQGVQFVESFYRKPLAPDFWEQYTGGFCGTEAQWRGDLRSDRKNDKGYPGCCLGWPVGVGEDMDGGQSALFGARELRASGGDSDQGGDRNGNWIRLTNGKLVSPYLYALGQKVSCTWPGTHECYLRWGNYPDFGFDQPTWVPDPDPPLPPTLGAWLEYLSGQQFRGNFACVTFPYSQTAFATINVFNHFTWQGPQQGVGCCALGGTMRLFVENYLDGEL